MKIHRQILLYIFLLSSNIMLSQNSLQTDISSGSKQFSQTNLNYSYTIGGVFIASSSNGNSLTQGFSQPELISVNNNKLKDIKLQVYPNPVVQYLTIRFIAENETVITTEISDLSGRKLMEEQFSFYESETNKQIKLNLENLPQSVYIISLKGKNKKIISSFKVTKK